MDRAGKRGSGGMDGLEVHDVVWHPAQYATGPRLRTR